MGLDILVNTPFGESRLDKPYLPGPLAVENGIIPDPEARAKPPTKPIGVDIANGRVPYVENGGIFKTASGLMSVDLVSATIGTNELIGHPTSKENVSDQGDIIEPGAVLIHGLREGWVKVAALALKPEQVWVADYLHVQDLGRITMQQSGIIMWSAGLDALPLYDIDEVDTMDGSFTAKQHLRIFGFNR